MAIQKLTALERGNPANSSGADAASAVNSLIDQAQSTEDLLQDLGTFNQDIIRDNVSVKDAIQDLEDFAFQNRDRIIVTTTWGSLLQSIPNHDGTAATEAVLEVGEADTYAYKVGPDGVVEVLIDLQSLTVICELHVKHSGGQASALALWAEVSLDGNTWTLSPENSLRTESIEKNGENMIVLDLSIDTPVSAGSFFRLVGTNTGAGILELSPPPSVTTSKGTAAGFSSKLMIRAKVS